MTYFSEFGLDTKTTSGGKMSVSPDFEVDGCERGLSKRHNNFDKIAPTAVPGVHLSETHCSTSDTIARSRCYRHITADIL